MCLCSLIQSEFSRIMRVRPDAPSDPLTIQHGAGFLPPSLVHSRSLLSTASGGCQAYYRNNTEVSFNCSDFSNVRLHIHTGVTNIYLFYYIKDFL